MRGIRWASSPSTPTWSYLDDRVFAFASEPRAFFAAGGLDLSVVRLALRLASAARLRSTGPERAPRPKGALRHVMADALPPVVFERSKTGFGPPVKHWFARELAEEVKARLGDSLAVGEGLLDRRALDTLLVPDPAGRVNGPPVWRVLVLEPWLRNVREGLWRRPGPSQHRASS